VLGGWTERARETLARLSALDYPYEALAVVGLETVLGLLVAAPVALVAPHAKVMACAWTLVVLTVALAASRFFLGRAPWAVQVAIAACLGILVVVLGSAALLYDVAVFPRLDPYASEQVFCLRDPPSDRRATNAELIAIETCSWLENPGERNATRRRGLTGLLAWLLAASGLAVATAWRLPRSSAWARRSRWVLVGAHVLVGFMLLRLVPTARAYGHWGLEYPEVRPMDACATERQGCCAADVGDVASTTALYLWGDRCEEPGLSRDPTACQVVETGTLRVIGQACR